MILVAHLNAENNPYVTKTHAAVDASPRCLFASKKARQSVEESTVDYEVLRKLPEVIESSKCDFALLLV